MLIWLSIIVLIIVIMWRRKKYNYLRDDASKQEMGKISEIFNFENIGGKIKNLAKWSCWITILIIWIATPISFIALVVEEYTAYLCWIPLAAACVGPIIVWVGSWAMYAFGEFVEDIHAMRNKNFPKKTSTPRQAVYRDAVPTAHSVAASTQKVSVEESADNDDDDFIEGICPDCGEKWSAFFDDTETICHKCKKKIFIS